jgi:hypothetical protein
MMTAISAHALHIETTAPDQFTVAGTRVQLTVRDARIIAVKSVQSGIKLTTPSPGMNMLTAGLGNMAGQIKELSRVHYPWGEPSIGQNAKRQATPLYGTCGAQTIAKLEVSQDQIVAHWRGLYYADQFHPDDAIELTFREDQNGAIVMQRQGRGRPGVFGLSVPVENLAPTGKIYLPSFGGLEYEAQAETEELIGLQDTTLFIEAPLMIYVGQNAAFGMWVEDERFSPYFAFIERGPHGAALSLEGLNLIPYESHKTTAPPPIKFDLFDGSGWIAAARPYRNWYQKTFAEEIAVRDASSWADDIMVIADGGNLAPGFERLPDMFKPENLLVQIWQPRKLGFTTGVPDYTPKDHYPELVQKLHDAGFKVMCYVCSLCAVYRCPAWERDQVGEFFLTRKNSITNYNGNEHAFDENLVGTIRAAQGKDQYAHLKPNAFLYGDPLSRGWRDYFCRVIKDMNELCGTDANYQDTLGCTADVGNGIVDGLAGAEGNAAFTRDLQKKVAVPMAAEFGSAPIAFGVRWPLNTARAWGGERFRAYRRSRQHPISPFLFGYRTWVSSIRHQNDEVRHTVLAVSDALSGFGMIGTDIPNQTEYGFLGQMLLRAKLFADRKLRPWYPENRYPENIRTMYQDQDGKIYRYYDDGKLQKMLDPEGRAVYGRLHGASSLTEHDLYIPRYPIQDENGAYNLDPAKHYALFPKKELNLPVSILPLPKGILLKRYYTTTNFAYVELDAAEEQEISATFQINEKNYCKAYLNDQEIPFANPLSIRCPAPARLLISSGRDTAPDTIRNISTDDGFQHGEGESLATVRKRKMAGRTMYFVNFFNVKSLDYLLTVPEDNNTLELCLVNTQVRHGNGSIVRLLVNGREIRSFDCTQPNPEWTKYKDGVPSHFFDQRMRQWLVPLKEYTGKQVLVTVQVDNKACNNADGQWISVPRLLPMTIAQIQENFLDPADNPPPSYKKPEGKVVKELTVQWAGDKFKLEDGIYTYAGGGLASDSQRYPIERDYRYIMSGEFMAGADGCETFQIGVLQYDANGRMIISTHINRKDGSETTLLQDVSKGSSELFVKDASKWTKGARLAFEPAADRSDLPYYALSAPIQELEETEQGWKVTLNSPLENSYAAGTAVCVHTPTATHSYACSAKTYKQFVRHGGKINWWPGAKTFKIMLISKKPLSFRDLKLEIMEEDK